MRSLSPKKTLSKVSSQSSYDDSSSSQENSQLKNNHKENGLQDANQKEENNNAQLDLPEKRPVLIKEKSREHIEKDQMIQKMLTNLGI